MSYYSPNNIEFTNHALARAAQRIKECRGLDEVDLICKLRKIFAKSQYDFEDDQYCYYAIDTRTGLYFIIDKYEGIVVSITNISYNKKLQLLS